jgi:predicted RecB family nuclease
MRLVADRLLLAPTDLSTFLGCRHKTALDLAVARRVLERPAYEDPYAALLRRRGEEHELQYVETLRREGLRVVALERPDAPSTAESLDRHTADTLAGMKSGADVIVQGRLAHDDLAGYADILRRVERPSDLGAWSYEAQDTKLARETKGGTILQLCAYSHLLEAMQGTRPEFFHVVTPDPVQPVRTYRVDEYLAYYRMVHAALADALTHGHDRLQQLHYPEPVEQCDLCAWEARCLARRRSDDHLSFIAGAARVHRQELVLQGHATLTAAATMAVPVGFKPSRGSRETYDRLGDQARVQHRQRTELRPVHELLPLKAGDGLSRLPAPSQGDMFLDLEGAPFAREGGREYLFGLCMRSPRTPLLLTYRGWWATTDAEERRAFEEVMDLIAAACAADPGMHVYHYNHYEPTAFKKLVGRHVTRVEELNAFLRAERFVDLYPIVRQSVRCGVESYSIKKLEPFYGYTRQVELKHAAQPLMAVELALEAQMPEALGDEIRAAVQGYNEDDCRSTEGLRDWLERLREAAVAAGATIQRPAAVPGEPAPAVSVLQHEVDALRARLLAGASMDAARRGHSDHARWLLAYLLDWHRREENAEWWEYFRLKEMPAEDLFEERAAIAGLRLLARVGPVVGKNGKPTRSVIDRYTYPPQELEIGSRGSLHARDGKAFGEVVQHDRLARIIEIQKGPRRAEEHPTDVFACDVVATRGVQQSVMRLAQRVLDGNTDGCGTALLQGQAPRLRGGAFEPSAGEDPATFAVRVVTMLDRTVLPIQGPPGAGKTYTGARMIRALVKKGKKVGVTATSHKVIRNLLEEVVAQAAAASEPIGVAAKVSEGSEESGAVRGIVSNEEALASLSTDVDVLGGTAWLWSRDDATDTVDVLFVDEAGQMSLANVLAVSAAANSVVLLGDPQQLDQPQKASHPDGVGISALEHVLAGAETMPRDRGIFLPTTFRMSPALTRFTSELFYEGKLEAKPTLAAQALRGTGRFDGSRLWLVPVEHDANQSASVEEVDAVATLIETLLMPGASWVNEHGHAYPLTGADLRVVAPFNAQVNRLTERLAAHRVPVGTVDKFQGQTAAVVIYSMTTSRPEDAPRGMEFLYSLNRLNVATSRARCAVFVVCSPRLLEPECRTPRQMLLANALCRYKELAQTTHVSIKA